MIKIMIEVLNFIFQSFWHFLGTIILLSIIVEGLVSVLKYIKNCK